VKLTYFHPRVVLQHSQYMSATACRPVSKTLSSAGPQPTFTLQADFFINDFALRTRTQSQIYECIDLPLLRFKVQCYLHWVEEVRATLTALEWLKHTQKGHSINTNVFGHTVSYVVFNSKIWIIDPLNYRDHLHGRGYNFIQNIWSSLIWLMIKICHGYQWHNFSCKGSLV